MSPTCVLFGMPPSAMTAQFSNSNGGIFRSFCVDQGKSRITKPGPNFQGLSLSARPVSYHYFGFVATPVELANRSIRSSRHAMVASVVSGFMSASLR
jgi:hypothetical protein